MPAYFESGMFVRKPAWHGLGTVVDDYPESWEKARELAGLTWDAVSAPMFGYKGVTADGKLTFDPAEAVAGEYFRDDNRQRIIRSDNGMVLGAPTDAYQVISHAEMGEICEALLDQGKGNIKYETLVSLEEGRAIAAVVYLDEPITIPGDNSLTLPYMALTNRHDGYGSCRAQATTVRIVCANTFAAAETEADRNGTVFTFTHSKSWKDRLEEARQAIRGLRKDFNDYVEFASHLTELKVTGRQTSIFISEFIPRPPESTVVSDRVLNNIETARQAVRDILAGPTCETIRGTAFGLVQAAGEYCDHYRGYRSKDTYAGRQLLRPEARKRQAVALVERVLASN